MRRDIGGGEAFLLFLGLVVVVWGRFCVSDQPGESVSFTGHRPANIWLFEEGSLVDRRTLAHFVGPSSSGGAHASSRIGRSRRAQLKNKIKVESTHIFLK